MAKNKRPHQSNDDGKGSQGQQPASGGERKPTIAGYFRGLFEANPRLLNERSNEPLLKQWRADHPNRKVTGSVKAGLSNIKSVLRSKGRKKSARKEAADQSQREALKGSVTAPPVQRPKGLNALEELIDDCLVMAKATDKEALEDVIDLLRRARNRVVWKMGEPE